MAAFAALAALAIAPTLVVEMPALADYPNHLARMSILASAGTAEANPYYRVAWALYPNLAMDLVVPPLARFMSVEVATKAFFLVGQLLVIGGAMAIEQAVKRRQEIAGLAALVVLHGLPFAFGFINFEFALGLALLAIAAWLGLRGRSWPLRLLVHTLCVAILFVGHLFALGVYGLVIGICELHAWWTGERRLGAAVATVATLAGPVLPLLVAMLALGGGAGGARTEWHILYKPHWLLSIVNGYSIPLSAVSVVAMLLVVYVLARRRLVTLRAEGLWVLLAFLVLFVVMPFRLLDTSFADVRVVVAAALVVPAFLGLSLPDRRAAVALFGFVAVIVVANVAVAASVWLSYRSDYAEFKTSFAALPRGAFVLIGHSGEAPDPPADLTEYPAYHAATLAVHHAGALVPTLFTYPGKQPVEVVPELRRLTVTQGGPAPLAVLTAIAAGRPAGEQPAYVRDWHHDFQYLYLLGDRVDNPLPQLLRELTAGRRFTLYEIRRP
jgi:hypothetical protein